VRILKQLFCFHLNWMPYRGLAYQPAKRFGKDIYECESCGKIRGFDKLNPPINYRR